LGVDVLEVWGMTETTGTINPPASSRPGTVGRDPRDGRADADEMYES
jgi:long-subunit acyl-CoA synthetase (AMP-forming)